jgi:DNA-binding response OmpR family regulator
MARAHILVAEDDRAIRQGLVDALESEGYTVRAESDGQKAMKAFEREPFDLVLLDVMMPELNGYDVCRAVRKGGSRTPVIMLTAKGEEIDKVVGLELGADDYVTKPFGLRELLARVAAQLRRSRYVPETAEAADLPDEFPFGKAVVLRKFYKVRLARQEYDITARELELLQCFAQHPNEVLSRDEILNQVWGIDYYGTTRTLDQHIAQLRKKIETTPQEPQTILTVHGVGYRYTP